jgi:hypothetical protein
MKSTSIIITRRDNASDIVLLKINICYSPAKNSTLTNFPLVAVQTFNYLGFTATSNLALDKTWTTYSKQEKRLNSFHLGGLRKINIKGQDKVNQQRGSAAEQDSIPIFNTQELKIKMVGAYH